MLLQGRGSGVKMDAMEGGEERREGEEVQNSPIEVVPPLLIVPPASLGLVIGRYSTRHLPPGPVRSRTIDVLLTVLLPVAYVAETLRLGRDDRGGDNHHQDGDEERVATHVDRVFAQGNGERASVSSSESRPTAAAAVVVVVMVDSKECQTTERAIRAPVQHATRNESPHLQTHPTDGGPRYSSSTTTHSSTHHQAASTALEML